MSWLTLLSVCYLIGSFPTAYLMGRFLSGIDIREVGDGNPGAANVYRELGHMPGIAVGAVDMAKGGVAVLVASILSPAEGAALVGGAASVMGHNWPVLLHFRGGRGAATAMGVLITLAPKAMLPLILLAGIPLFRYRSVNLFFAFLYAPLPVALWLLQYSSDLIGYAIALPVLVGVTHYLTSRRIGEAPQESPPS